MGRDLTLYPRSASKDELRTYLEGLGFTRCKHFWDWPAGTLNFSWFDEKDFRSIDGVSADVYPVTGDEAKVTGNAWALHVRNTYGASWHDVKMLNDVLRGARRLFGGTIEGDYGRNRYAPLWVDTSTPISRGISAIYQRVDQELRSVKSALPESLITLPSQEPTNKKMRAFREFERSLDPSRVLYNGLVPFAIAMFEFFFSRAFRVLLAYDSFALAKRSSHNLRVDFTTLLQIDARARTVEDVIAQGYSFQNLDQLNKAYKEWLEIDVRKILFRRKRIGRSVAFLETRISEAIKYRHGVVHHFELDRSLTREGYIAILDAVHASMREFIAHLERKYSVTIDLA
ncbi:MAG: hypothetical protein IBJ19_02135 [Gemmatimonadaceae bacterium]|jgi:hypothetical protein|nr:hypothetical protein [Gemmatimonadaceae bacterium]